MFTADITEVSVCYGLSAGSHSVSLPPSLRQSQCVLTSFPHLAVGHRVPQAQAPVGFQDRLSVPPAEHPADLLLEQDASLCRHVSSQSSAAAHCLSEHGGGPRLLSADVSNCLCEGAEGGKDDRLTAGDLTELNTTRSVPPCFAVRTDSVS